MTRELPPGWSAITLGEVIQSMKNGLYRPVQAYADNGTACLRMYNIDDGRIVWKDLKRMKLSPAEVHEYGLLPGDMLVNRVNSRELVGKAAVIPEGLEPCVFESKNIRVRFNRQVIDPVFANYALLLWGRHHFSRNAQQVVGMASISQPQIAAFPLPLAPLNEQRRIVAKLKTLIGIVGGSRERLKKTAITLGRFRQSILAAACAGRLTADWRELNRRSIEESWKDQTLAEVCAVITDGDHQPPPKQSSGIPFLTIGNVSSGRLDFSSSRFVSKQYFAGIKSDRRPVRDDVLYTVVATIGIPVIVDTDQPFCFQRHIALLRASKAITPKFLQFLLGSPTVINEAQSRATGTAQPTLSLGSLRTIPIKLPPLNEQKQIVRRVNRLFALADRLERRLVLAEAHVSKLSLSLLAKAFRGEVVPTEADLARHKGSSHERPAALLEADRHQQSTARRVRTEGARALRHGERGDQLAGRRQNPAKL